MRIGVLDTWLARRYLPFWRPFLVELGAELVGPEAPFEEALAFPAEGVGEAGRAALGRIAELKEKGVHRILLPDIQLGVEAERGSGACPWVRDLAAVAPVFVPGLPPLWRVPGELGEGTLSRAAEIGALLVENPQRVRLALERTRAKVGPPGPFRPSWAAPEGALGLAAPPYVLEEERLYRSLREALLPLGLTLADRPPAELRDEGARLGLRLKLPSDLEWAGAAHALARRHDVRAVVLLYEGACEGSARVARWIAERLPKPALPVPLARDPAEVLRQARMVLGEN